MGVGIHSAIHLLKSVKKFQLTGDLGTLGVQDTSLTELELRDMALRYGVADPGEGWEAVINDREPYKGAGELTGQSLWDYLQFNSVTTLDVNDYEGTDEIIDLNSPDVPPHLEKRFDVLFDGGTIEHLFHLPNALKNLHTMTRPGGVIIHQTPSLPLIDHGFYMFSPTLFHDYYTINGYEILDLQLVMYSLDSKREPCWFTDYSPGCLGFVSNRGYCFPGMNFLVLGIFRKNEDSTGGVIPQQGAYEGHWKAAAERKRQQE